MNAYVEFSIKFSEQDKKNCLSMHYSGTDSFLFVNGVKIYQFKAKDSELNVYPLYLDNISKYFALNNLKITGQHEYTCDFLVD